LGEFVGETKKCLLEFLEFAGQNFAILSFASVWFKIVFNNVRCIYFSQQVSTQMKFDEISS
jgi:hypothetical protein